MQYVRTTVIELEQILTLHYARQWPSPIRTSTSISFPRQSISTYTLKSKDKYPTLHLLSIDQYTSKDLRSPLRAFVSEKNTHAREAFYKNTSRLCPRGGRPIEIPSQKVGKDDPLFRSYVSLRDADNLCDVLSHLSYCSCDAATSDSRLRQHMMSLRLASSTGSNDKGFLLETVFQASELHQERPPERGWRSIAVHMARHVAACCLDSQLLC